MICSVSAAVADAILPARAVAALGSRANLVQAKRHSLSQIHGKVLSDGGDAHQPVAMAQVVVGESEFLAAEDQRHRGGGDDARGSAAAPYSSRRSGCCNSRCPTLVVPTTSLQSATASATVANSSASCSSGAAPTAERASRNATS